MKLTNLLFILLALGVFSSCSKKDEFNYPDGTVGISKITYFPVVTLKGDDAVIISKGETYTDAGATATEGTTTIPVTISGSVNNAVAGVYSLTYSAVNKDGFSASTKRTVVVYSTDASAAAHDLSGTYLRAATGANAVWTKIAPGLYYIDNPGGAVGVNVQVYAFNQTGYTVFIPTQISSDGNTSSSTSFNYVNGTPPSYTLVFSNPGYGGSTRTFVKQ